MLSATVKSIQDIMRQDAGVDGDAQRISQMVWMIFLKVFDDKEKEWELEDATYKSAITEKFRYRNWASNKEGITGDELLDFISEMFKKLKSLNTSKDDDPRGFIVKEVFEDAYNYMKSGTLIRQVINKLNEIDFNKSEDKHLFNEVYEKILSDLQSAGNAGEYYTPRAVTQFIVDIVNPKLGEKVLDPACGTGGFLVSSLENMKKQVTSDDDLENLQKNINGVEKKQLPHLLCTTNMILHGIEVPNININVKPQRIDWSEKALLKKELVDNYRRFELEEGDIVLSMDGSISNEGVKVAIITNDNLPCYLLQRVCRLKPSPKIKPEYLYWMLQTSRFIEYVLSSNRSIAISHISAKQILSYKIPIPPLNIQKEMIEFINDHQQQISNELLVNILSRVLKFYREKAKFNFEISKCIEFIEKLRGAILQEAVSGKLVPQDPDNEPASELLKKIKAEKKKLIKDKLIKNVELQPVSRNDLEYKIPISWEFVRLFEISSLITDGTHLTPNYVEKGRPFLSAQNIKPFRFMPEVHRCVSENDYQYYIKNKKAELNDILLTRVGAGIGEAAVVNKEIDFAFYVSAALIKTFSQYVNPNYLVMWLNSPIGRERSSANTYGIGHSQGNLNLSLINNFVIPLPPFNEQKRIVEKGHKLMQLCDEMEKKIIENQRNSEYLLGAVLKEAFVS